MNFVVLGSVRIEAEHLIFPFWICLHYRIVLQVREAHFYKEFRFLYSSYVPLFQNAHFSFPLANLIIYADCTQFSENI